MMTDLSEAVLRRVGRPLGNRSTAGHARLVRARRFLFVHSGFASFNSSSFNGLTLHLLLAAAGDQLNKPLPSFFQVFLYIHTHFLFPFCPQERYF
jgi:hypothetical protein